MSLISLIRAGLIVALPAAAVTARADSYTGLSSSQSPYVLGTAPGVSTVSVLTVGDSVNLKADGITPYRMVGIPDGLGAFNNGDGTMTLLMNHELPNNRGVVRDHGFAGAFVSKWILDRKTLEVLHGEDLIKQAFAWNRTTNVFEPIVGAFARFCSADLADESAYYDKKSKLGYTGRIFLSGEENGVEGRLFAHLMNGASYELPWLGRFSWENSVANPGTGRATVVVGTDDATGGQIYIYVGAKTRSADAIEAAGLRGGTLYGIKVTGYAAEPAGGIPSGTPFTVHSFGNAATLTGAQLETASVAVSVTGFLRPEDCAWDPKNPSDLYFVTTNAFTAPTRLWRLRFNDPANPAAGGTIDMLLDGTEGPKMMDNITVSKGKVLLQEDPGNQSHVAKIWSYDIKTDTVELIAEHDPARFVVGGAQFLTQDEESSGIIPLKGIVGNKWHFGVVQAHYATDAELVEGGQLFALYVNNGDDEPDDLDDSQ